MIEQRVSSKRDAAGVTATDDAALVRTARPRSRRRARQRTRDEDHRRSGLRARRTTFLDGGLMREAAVPFWSPAEIEASLSGTRRRTCSQGSVLAYPTETVYGFGGAVDRDSVERLVELKRRPPAKPFLLLIVGQRHARAARPPLAELRGAASPRATGRARSRWCLRAVSAAFHHDCADPRAASRCDGRPIRRSQRMIARIRRPDHLDEREPARASAGDDGRGDC